MKKNISDLDLFYFVFFPHLLPKDKLVYLHNSDDFLDEINFYTKLKNELKIDISAEDKNLISKKIKAYSGHSELLEDNIIYLYPVHSSIKKNDNKFILAAASDTEQKTIFTRTYFDRDKIYIVKVINYENFSKIFVFSTVYEIIKDFDIIIKPQNLQYHLEDNTKPLELNFNVEPENIILKFNLSCNKSQPTI